MPLTIALVATAATAAAAAAPPTCAPVTPAQVEGQLARFAGALATHDPDRVTALFAPDAVLLPTLSNRVRTTPAEVRDYFVHFLAKSPAVHVDSSTVHLGCNIAERVGTWTWTLTDPVTHRVSQAAARYSFVYRFDGRDWRIDHLHSSLMPEPVTKTAAQ